MTNELPANMLGFSDETAMHGARQLQTAGFINYAEGQIKVLDRHELEDRVCQYYGVVQCSGR